MPRLRFLLRWSAVAVLPLACGRDVSPPGSDSVHAPVAGEAPAAITPGRASTWLPVLGPALLLPTDTVSDGVVLLPLEQDATTDRAAAASLAGHHFMLLDRAGAVGTAAVQAVDSADGADECPARPVLHLEGVPTSRRWTVAFESPAITPIAFDSLAGLSGRDSAARVAAVARIASSVPSTDPSFANLPYDVGDARSFLLGDRRILVAIIARRVNREASPLQERTLLVAELDAQGKEVATWHERSSGPEDDIEGNELLGGFTVGTTAYLVVARDGPRGITWSLIERSAPGTWRVHWTSRETPGGC